MIAIVSHGQIHYVVSDSADLSEFPLISDQGRTYRAMPLESPSFVPCQNAPVEQLRYVDGAVVIAPLPAPEVPVSISPRQIRQALSKFGFRQQVESAIASSSDQDLKDWWEFASDFQRSHPEVLAMGQQMGFTPEQMDQLWIYGATI